jgi:hypothetical protein
MRVSLLFAGLSLCLMGALGGCDDDPCIVDNCSGSGLYMFKAKNAGNQPMSLVVDGGHVADLEPGKSHCEELTSSAQHLVEFLWQDDGSAACSAALSSAGECKTDKMNCEATK